MSKLVSEIFVVQLTGDFGHPAAFGTHAHKQSTSRHQPFRTDVKWRPLLRPQ